MSAGYTRRRTIGAAGALLVGVSLAGCSGDGGDGGGNAVEMTDDFTFVPDSLTVTVGDAVVWENVGSVDHTVTAYEDEMPDGADYFASGGFDSEQAARNAYPDEGVIGAGETFEHTFETAGSYGYFCIPHEGVGMTETITVQE